MTPTLLPHEITPRSRRRQGRETERWLERIYPLPDPLRSYEDLQRACHLDLPGLSREDLWRQHFRCDHRIRMDDHPSPWLYARLEAIRAELRGRGRR